MTPSTAVHRPPHHRDVGVPTKNHVPPLSVRIQRTGDLAKITSSQFLKDFRITFCTSKTKYRHINTLQLQSTQHKHNTCWQQSARQKHILPHSARQLISYKKTMPTIHYMKRCFYRSRGLALPRITIQNTK